MNAFLPIGDQKNSVSWRPDWAGRGTAASPDARSAIVPRSGVLKPLVSSSTAITLVQQPKGPEPAVRLATQNGQLERRLFEALSAMKIKTAEVAMHLSTEWRDRLFGYLDFLHDAEDWDDRDEPANLASFTTFLRLSLHLKAQKRPGMGLTSAGNLVATWTVGNRHLTIECLANDVVLWSVSAPEGDVVETAAGRCAILRLIQVLAPYDPQNWFANAG